MKRLWVILFVLPLFAQNRVVVNTQTGRIHLSGVYHLPDSSFQKKYEKIELAKSEGFELCTACFDSRPNISDYDLEKQLATQSIIAIKQRYEVMYEHDQLDLIRKIMKSVLVKWPEPLKGYSYRIQIIRDDSPNAFALAGGNIYLTTGLIGMVENEDELEAVIAHEIAHVERRHTLRSYKQFQRKQLSLKAITLLMSTIATASGNQNIDAISQLTKLMAEFSALLAIKGYSRELETEADMYAQLYFRKNDLNIRALLSVFDRLATFSATRLGYVVESNAFSDHPSIRERMNRVEFGKFYDLDESITIQLNPVGVLKLITSNEPIINGQPPIKDRLSPREKRELADVNFGFLSIIIDKIFVFPSSPITNKAEILLMGSIINNHRDNYTLNNFNLYFPGKSGLTQLNGVSEIYVFNGSTAEFKGSMTVFDYLSDDITKEIIMKRLMGYITVSRVSVDEEMSVKKNFAGIQIASLITVK